MNPNRQNRLPLPSFPSPCPSSYQQHLLFFSDEEEDAPRLLQDPLEKPIGFGELAPFDLCNRSALLSGGARSVRDSIFSGGSIESIHQYYLLNNGAGSDMMEELFMSVPGALEKMEVEQQQEPGEGQQHMVEPEEEEEEDEVERLERKILKKRKLITRLLRLRMKTRTFHNSFRVVMNFHQMHLKDKASEKLIEMPEVISNEAELLEEVIRKEIAKTQIDLEEKRLELDNLLDEEGDYSDEMEEPNSESAQEGDSSDSNFSEEFSSPNQAQPDPHPIFRPNMEGINQVAQEELHYIYGFDGFEEYLADLESEINSEASSDMSDISEEEQQQQQQQ